MSTELSIDEKVNQLQSILSVGSSIIEDGDDPDDPDQIGVIVEPRQDELVTARRDFCGFTDVTGEYVVVAWSWSETPEEVIERRWEFIADLRPASTPPSRST